MWFWPVLILVLVILFVWWALTRQAGTTENPASNDHHSHDVASHVDHDSHPAPVKADVTVEAVSEPVKTEVIDVAKEDNFQIIEGIGPKISSVLKGAGIKSFAQLAAMDADKVRDILIESDARLGRIADPTTWAKQSQLAAEGKLTELKEYQNTLKGGRGA
jgi:predicted flap endonuclease-1-like 5' DNA nuclease